MTREEFIAILNDSQVQVNPSSIKLYLLSDQTVSEVICFIRLLDIKIGYPDHLYYTNGKVCFFIDEKPSESIVDIFKESESVKMAIVRSVMES